MPVTSMTGYAHAEGELDGVSWSWEAKSVNGKGLDVRLRVPPGYDFLEPAVRTAIAQRAKRGNISVTLSLGRPSAGPAIRINHEILAQVLAAARDLADEPGIAPLSVDGLLAVRGVIESGEAEETVEHRLARQAPLLTSWERALALLGTMREAEGARLAEVLGAQIDEIETLVAAAGTTAAAQPAALKQRLRDQVAALLETGIGLPEERLAQEAALLIGKADIREELDRLTGHVAAARELLAEANAVGRRLDFLCQEFNREANTLCSKSSDLELTRIGLSLKATIEQFREQVQNIE